MSFLSPKFYSTFALVALAAVTASTANGQAKLVTVSSPAASGDTQAAQGWHDTMPNRLISAHVRDGILTIDGMVAKVQLNYDIAHSGYMYFFVPGVGTAVVSMAPIADGVKVADAFDGEKLAFAVGGHSFELSSETPLLSRYKSRNKADVYVRLDHSTLAVSRYPKMGYGDTTEPPYVWPLSQPERISKDKVEYAVTPPPLPKSVLPETASANLPSKQ